LPVNPVRTRVQHVNVQVATLDDMVASYQRVKELGFDMALSVGQHTNDKELSYYARTPPGFDLAADDTPGHQHLGPHPGGADGGGQVEPVRDCRGRWRTVKTPSRHSAYRRSPTIERVGGRP
jgi:Glyoxalase/Bleomycin resistance protein/Dioxygenase superfamily